MSIECNQLYELKGKQILEYSLISKDIKVSFLNLGCTITEIMTPDREGNVENIVLTYKDKRDYVENKAYLGCIVGRYAGRISKARFKIDDVEYSLDKNDGYNSLHGGFDGIHKKVWESKPYESDDKIGVKFRYKSPHLEGGYPGELDIEIDYYLDSDNRFYIDIYGRMDKKSIINMTNHTYFNLANMNDTILNHSIYIDSNKFCELDEELIPTGNLICDKTFDFTSTHTLACELDRNSEQIIAGGIDHPFVLGDSKTAILSHEGTGRKVKIQSNQPVAVVYTGNMLDDSLTFCGGKAGEKYLGICFEMQDYPDGINQESFPTKIYDINDTYLNSITMTFSIF